MRAKVTSFSAVGVPRRTRILFWVVVAVCAVGLGYFGARQMQRAQVADAAEQVRREWRDSDAARTASRYGDVKLPLRGETCTAYAFDNQNGSFVDERVTECETPKPATPPLPAEWNNSGGTLARAKGVAAGFRRFAQ